MAYCDLLSTCFFYNEQASDLPSTTAEYLRYKYCRGCYVKCAIFRVSNQFGQDNVPTYFYPDDFVELPIILFKEE